MHIYNFNENWYFSKDQVDIKDIKFSDFCHVNLPHTWNNIDGQDGGNDYYRGTTTYCKTFIYKRKNVRTIIEFEGVNSVARVYLNNQYLGMHQGGYSRFRFDITDVLKEEENIIIVYVDNTHDETIYPLAADFTFYGGIYRSVNIIEVNDVSFNLFNHASQGVLVSQKSVTHQKALIGIHAEINAIKENTCVDVMLTIFDNDGLCVTKKTDTLQINHFFAYETEMEFFSPHLWHGIEDPYLYTLEAVLMLDGRIIDKRLINLGLRSLESRNDGFYLNGTRYQLNGVSRHQDWDKIGNALTRKHHQIDFELIQEIGANAVRLAHYQHDDYVYDLCDKMGFIVWAEIPYITLSSSVDLEGTNAIHQLKELILQNYNHPSIAMWGIANEITIGGKKPHITAILNTLNRLAKSMDPYRLTTLANVSTVPFDDDHVNITDVMGYNQYLGWYRGSVEDFDPWLEEYHRINPKRPLALSEYGVEGIHLYHSEEPKVKDYTEEYHALWHEKAYEIIEKKPYVWGTYIWNMFTFAADFRDEGGSKGLNNKGLVTFDRQIKKDAFYYYKAKWSKQPVLHICSKRFIDRVQDKIQLKIYSNLENLVLYVNDQKVINMEKQGVIFTAEITLIDGENHCEVKAENLIDEAVFIKKNHENTSYLAPKSDKKAMLHINFPNNWFDSIVDETEPLDIDFSYLSIKDSMETILTYEDGSRLLHEIFKEFIENERFIMIKGMSIERFRDFSKENFPYSALVNLNDLLQKIKK